jgi:AraC-type DNA-binding domain-containing proteins
MRLNKHSEQQPHLFQRLFLFNIILVVLVTFMPVIIYYQYFSKALTEQLENINKQTVMQFRSSIDEQFLKDSIKMIQTSFFDSTEYDTLNKPMTSSIRHDSTAIRNVVNKLDSLQSNLQNVRSIDVYYKNDNVLFYDSRFCFLSEDTCSIGSRQGWLEDFQQSQGQVSWLPPSPYSYAGMPAEPVITYVRSIPYFAPPENRKAIVAVNLSASALDTALQQLKNPADGLIMIVDEHGSVIASNRPQYQIKELQPDENDWLDRVLSNQGQGQGDNKGIFNDKIAGNSTMVSYLKSDYNNWRYVSLVNKDLFYKKATDLRNRLVMIVILFLAIGLLISYVLTKRAHKPIRNVIGSYSTQIIDLNQKVEINKPVIRHNYIRSLLYEEASHHALSLASDYMQMDSNWTRFCTFVLQTPKQELFENEQAFSFRLIALLESIKEPGYQIWAIKDYGNQVQGIIFLDEKSEMSTVTQPIIEMVGLIYENDYKIALGGTYPLGEHTISVSFREAVEALKYFYLYPDEKMLSYDKLAIAVRQRSGSSNSTIDELEVCIRACDERKAVLLIRKLSDEMRSGSFTVEHCKTHYSDLINSLRKVVESIGFNSASLFSCDIREQFKELDNIGEAAEWTTGLIQKAIEAIENRKQSLDYNIEIKIKNYINEHLYNDISLDRVADEMNISANYLGKLFKKSSGINFTEYLTECRLSEAAKLLKETKLSVNEIANKLGYSSTNHFIRIFKEKYGDIPKKYQLLCK